MTVEQLQERLESIKTDLLKGLDIKDGSMMDAKNFIMGVDVSFNIFGRLLNELNLEQKNGSTDKDQSHDQGFPRTGEQYGGDRLTGGGSTGTDECHEHRDGSVESTTGVSEN